MVKSINEPNTPVVEATEPKSINETPPAPPEVEPGLRSKHKPDSSPAPKRRL